ncbi:MAG TPA: S-adenosylmethionine:tRNA ribosyltransferase-isomerase [Polyangiaceae bacterium]
MNAVQSFLPATFARRIAETRLLVVRVARRSFREATPRDLPTFFGPGDVLVVNDAATIPSSVFGATERGDAVELRLLSLPDERGEVDAVVLGAGDWHTPTERRPPPPPLALGDRVLGATVVRAASGRRVRLRFEGDRDAALARLYRAGKPVQYAHISEPLPPWDVQNVYAAEPWAAEMPSAGRILDFAALDALRKRGAVVARLTHGAGLSSIGDAALDASLPWTERYRIPPETAEAVAGAKRVIAIGTSVVRALESASGQAGEGTTDLRIDARHRLRVVSGLLTGMHDPTTSHADLVSAFVPRDLLSEASAFASARGFLGHELGDSCLILAG